MSVMLPPYKRVTCYYACSMGQTHIANRSQIVDIIHNSWEDGQ